MIHEVTPNRILARALGVDEAFPWQTELLRRALGGELPRALDIPTGLGKTAVMAIWLAARAAGAPLPRRLVYVVDRRAVVDQATEVAIGLRKLVDDTVALLGDAEAAFDWSDRASTRFALRAAGRDNPVEAALRFLAEAEVKAVAPHESAVARAWNVGWGGIEARPESASYPHPEPSSPATLIAVLRSGTRELVLDHWGDATRRDAVKFWAGAGGYPGAALARDALELVRRDAVAAADDPFALARPQGSSFRLDWARYYIPIDAGFSLNEHGDMTTVGYPLVEVLGALGLTHARPARTHRLNKLEYRYGVVGRVDGRPLEWLPPALLRAALGASPLPFPTRRFRMLLGWPGKEGQARSITTVHEETQA